MRKALSTVLYVLLVLPGLAACSTAAMTSDGPPAEAIIDDPWPRQLVSGGNTFSVFQPQYERWEQGRLEGRAAVAVEHAASPQPVYGVVWFSARAETDKDTRMVTLEDLTIARADFPTVPDGGAGYVSTLRQSLAGQPLTLALDRLQADLEVERVEDPGRIVQVKNDPPRIIVSQGPALLVRIDGQPVLRPIADGALLRVVNTRALLLLDRASGQYSVWLMDRWLVAPKLEGPWTPLFNPSASLERARSAVIKGGQVDLLDDPAPDLKLLLQQGTAPAIYVSTVPTELILLRGQPTLAPIAATDILEVTNTDDDLFVYTPEQAYYALLSGRWFRALSLQGPWAFVAGGRLPADFARIPESHPKGAVLASVPGTPQARQAVIANDIPQTATISRRDARLTVRYDGLPQLKPIEATPLQYVVNASVPVIAVDASTSYALQDGVWFVAGSPAGPWAVATSVPAVIYTIPASSPLHYVTYAYVYGSTPDVVYTGYTPGYLGTVVAPGGSVVFGTGYLYPGWAGTLWFPAPVTWGWGPFDLGFGVDVFTGFELGFAVGPYWGWHRGISHVNVYNHWGDHVHLTRHAPVGRGEVGRRVGGGDVYAGRDGRVYRRDGGGHWQEYNRGRGWEGLSGPAAEHERSHRARETGQQRLDSLNGHGLAHGLTGGPPHGGGGAHGFAGGMHGGGGARGGGGGHR